MKFLSIGLLVLGLVSATQAATLEQYSSGTATPTTLGGYSMTDFGVTGIGGTPTSIASPISGTADFVNRNNTPEPMVRTTANNVGWWNNGEAGDYDVFLTGEHLITILLPENTRAFSFTVGANLGSTGNNAWLTATETNGSGIATKKWFNVSRTNTPSFGIYADNSAGSCSSSLTSVTIDPVFWGFGNFSINQDKCVSVPESSSLYLLVFGLIGLLGLAKRKV
jgi:hypothetical protein